MARKKHHQISLEKAIRLVGVQLGMIGVYTLGIVMFFRDSPPGYSLVSWNSLVETSLMIAFLSTLLYVPFSVLIAFMATRYARISYEAAHRRLIFTLALVLMFSFAGVAIASWA